MSIIGALLSFTAEEIGAIIAGVSAGIVSIITAIGSIINSQRRKNGNMTCCMTGRQMKPKKSKNKEQTE